MTPTDNKAPRELSPIEKVARDMTTKIYGQMDANLFESIISLFNQGILVHYVVEPRTELNMDRFNLTISGANGVKFEGRERLIELQDEYDKLQAELDEAHARFDEANLNASKVIMALQSRLEKAEGLLRELKENIESQVWQIKLTGQKLIDDDYDRDWVVETDVNKWHSIKMLESGMNKIDQYFAEVEK